MTLSRSSKTDDTLAVVEMLRLWHIKVFRCFSLALWLLVDGQAAGSHIVHCCGAIDLGEEKLD